MAQLSGWKRRIAKMIYGDPPQGTVHDALKKFLLAEEISPGFYSKNLLMIIKCYTELNSQPAAMEFAKLLMKLERKTQEDEEVCIFSARFNLIHFFHLLGSSRITQIHSTY